MNKTFTYATDGQVNMVDVSSKEIAEGMRWPGDDPFVSPNHCSDRVNKMKKDRY